MQAVNIRLGELLEARISRSQAIDPSYEHLWREISRVVLAGGKRLRPLLSIVAFSALGGTDQNIYDVACAQEFLHASLLIHDDIMDKDLTRHQQPNIAGSYQQHYKQREAAEHLASSAAILAGDLLLGMAYEVMSGSGFSPDLLGKAVALLGNGVFSVAAGQLLDMEASHAFGDDNSLKIAAYKTSSYSFVAPLCIGATLAGAKTGQLSSMESIGNALGIGFQLADDLLGLFGDEKVTGKSVISDLREGKATFLIQEAFRRSRPSDQAKLQELWGKSDASHGELEEVQVIVVACGARQATYDLIDFYALKARKSLVALQLDEGFALELDGIIERIIKRQS